MILRYLKLLVHSYMSQEKNLKCFRSKKNADSGKGGVFMGGSPEDVNAGNKFPDQPKPLFAFNQMVRRYSIVGMLVTTGSGS